MNKITAVKGTRDFYPQEMAVLNWIMEGWRCCSVRNGFEQYDSPIFEYLQLYTQKSGEEIAGQLFSLTDRGGRQLAIRPETTPSLARMINQRISALPRPIKWFSISRLCRAERPQRGRLREFFQWNIDIIGDDSPVSDAECIYTAVDYLRSVGLTSKDIVVKFSSRSLLAALLKDMGFTENQLDGIYSLLDKRSKLPPETFAALAKDTVPDALLREKLLACLDSFNPQGSQDPLEKLSALAQAKDTKPYVASDSDPVQLEVAKLEQLKQYLQIMGIYEYCQFDINIVRGLAYYTGPVFEIFDRGSQLRALCGGGRYDNLLAGLGGPQVPATGFGMGDVVLEILLEEKKLLRSFNNELHFFVAYAGVEFFDKALQLTCRLRAQGYSAAFDYKRLALGKQLKQAAQQNARFAVIVGQETVEADEITLKDMTKTTQKTVPLPQFLADPLAFLDK